MNKQAQIGETMTWVVGTIVIIVILAIAIFIVQFNMTDRTLTRYISNDLIFTKSVVSFLKYDSNFENLKNSINSGDYDSFKSKLKIFIESASKTKWNFAVFVDDSAVKQSVIRDTIHSSFSLKYAYFYFNLGNKKIKLKFDGKI